MRHHLYDRGVVGNAAFVTDQIAALDRRRYQRQSPVLPAMSTTHYPEPLRRKPRQAAQRRGIYGVGTRAGAATAERTPPSPLRVGGYRAREPDVGVARRRQRSLGQAGMWHRAPPPGRVSAMAALSNSRCKRPGTRYVRRLTPTGLRPSNAQPVQGTPAPVETRVGSVCRRRHAGSTVFTNSCQVRRGVAGF